MSPEVPSASAHDLHFPAVRLEATDVLTNEMTLTNNPD